MKTGVKTTEFWMTLIMSLITAVLGVLAAKGLLTREQSDLIVQMAGALMTIVSPLVIGWMTTRYTHGRTALKLQHNDFARSNLSANSTGYRNL